MPALVSAPVPVPVLVIALHTSALVLPAHTHRSARLCWVIASLASRAHNEQEQEQSVSQSVSRPMHTKDHARECTGHGDVELARLRMSDELSLSWMRVRACTRGIAHEHEQIVTRWVDCHDACSVAIKVV